MKLQWKNLPHAQRIMVCVQAFLILLFLILYCVIGTQKVIKYDGGYLRCRTDGEKTVYSGEINGQEIIAVVGRDSVEYRVDNAVYGPYTVVHDPSAVPDKENLPFNTTDSRFLTGVEVWEGETLLYRGAYHNPDLDITSLFYLMDLDGQTVYNGEIPDPYTTLKLFFAPGVTSRGIFGIFLLGALLCVINMVSILYADELFRWSLRFRIVNVEDAEPSEWEIISRWIGWCAISVCVVIMFILGLKRV